jgi:biotin synthase-like enzyme
MGEEKQMMCFTAGANAVFTGEKMLTTECNGWEEDRMMFERWGLRPMQVEESNKDFSEGMPTNLGGSSWGSVKDEKPLEAIA